MHLPGPLVALCLLASACTPPEARTARKFLACLADHDVRCLRQHYAPFIPRLAAWAAATKTDPLHVGAYARQAMLDADDPHWALLPLECATASRERRLPTEVYRDLGSCACRNLSARKLAPREERARNFEPSRARAVTTHPAMEVLANRSTAEALRVQTITRVQCQCRNRTVEVAVLDIEGRNPPYRFFKAAGICGGGRAALESFLARAERLLSGDLSAP
jgi:hypothetical protein